MGWLDRIDWTPPVDLPQGNYSAGGPLGAWTGSDTFVLFFCDQGGQYPDFPPASLWQQSFQVQGTTPVPTGVPRKLGDVPSNHTPVKVEVATDGSVVVLLDYLTPNSY